MHQIDGRIIGQTKGFNSIAVIRIVDEIIKLVIDADFLRTDVNIQRRSSVTF